MQDMKLSFYNVLCEAKKDGLTFEIVIIREGKSKNGTYYPKETLMAAREKFEGARVAFYEWNGLYDHLSEEQRAAVPAGFPSQVAGIVTGVKFRKLAEGDYGLTGTLKLTEENKWLADIFKLGLESGNSDVLGFSIDVLGDCERRKVEGEEVEVVREIGVVNEITVVTNPAAGGRLERMVASVNTRKKEAKEMKDSLLKLIASLRPKKLDGVSLTEAEEPKVKELAIETAKEVAAELNEGDEMKALLSDLVEAVQRGDMKKVLQCAQEIIDKHGGTTMKKETEAEVKQDSEPKPDAAAADMAEIKTKQEATDKRIAESEKRICEATLRAMLAESKLPEAAKTRIKERFTGKTFPEDELAKEIEAEVKYCSALAESLHPSGLRVELGDTEPDKLGDAVEGMLKGEDINKQPRFRSIHEAFSKVEKVSPFASGFKDRIWIGMVKAAQNWNEKRAMKEAIATASFAEIFGDRLHKRMVAEYSEAGLYDWRKIVNVVSASDFLNNRVTLLGGHGTNMPTVAEAGPYTDLASPTDEEATYVVTKRGGLETISMEAIKNDNLRALQMIPKRLGRGCKNTLFQFVFDFPRANAAVWDTVAYFHANHGNLGSTALSWTEFKVAVAAMMDQTGYNEANFFPNVAPKYIAVPNELWGLATEIAKSTYSQATGRAETQENIFSNFALEVIRVPYWTDANDWCIFADPKQVPTIEIAFLDGNEEPELLQEAANAGSDFTNDQIRYKVRHIYGGAVVEYRSAYKAVVA